MSIKKSLRILLIMSSMIPVILVSVIAHRLLTDRLVEINTQNLQRTAQTTKNGLDAFLQTQKTEVSLLALQEEFVNAVILSNKGYPNVVDSVNKLLSKRCLSYNNCERISLYNIRNEAIASSDSSVIGDTNNSSSALSYMQNTRDTAIAVGDIYPIIKDHNIIFTIEIGAPIVSTDTKSVQGYVISTLNVSYFKDFLSATTIGDTGFCELLDQNGTIIYHPSSHSVGSILNAEKLTSLVNEYNEGSISQSGTFEYTDNNIKQLCSYSILPEQNWVLLVRQDLSEIKSVTMIMLSLLFVICGVLLFVIVFFANYLVKRFSAPIIALRDAMRTASDGNLMVQSNIKSRNELGELSKSFNKMLHIIRTNYEDLEAMHEKLLSKEEQLRTNYDHIEFLAYHDTLTNLPNKLAFLNYVNAILASTPLNSKMHAIYFVDLDNFKTVNDTLGHEYGDVLLVRTSQLLTSLLDNRGMLARAGGDEFLLFRENIANKIEAVDFASQIIEGFRIPLDLDGEIIYVSLSIGISLYPDNGLSSKILIKNSDIAMYKSKDTGKNKFTLFDTTMEEELNRNTLILEVLRNAIGNNEIYIEYQPLMEIETYSIIGYEALMRIYSERLGSLTPSEFIPIAEESGLIIELSTWLIRQACFFNKKLIDLGSGPYPISVNISSVQINRPGFVAMLSEILTETQLSPQYLELEITESTLLSSIMDATMLLNDLQKLGVKISLDDFGTGYSSLNYLTKLPINTLKIDKSFIDNICANEKDVQIAETIIRLAHGLHIKVVAEGVETEAQLNLLKLRHCDIIQGYLFSPPLSSDQLLKIIRDNHPAESLSLF